MPLTEEEEKRIKRRLRNAIKESKELAQLVRKQAGEVRSLGVILDNLQRELRQASPNTPTIEKRELRRITRSVKTLNEVVDNLLGND